MAGKRSRSTSTSKRGGQAAARKGARNPQLVRLRRRTSDLMLAYISAGRATKKLKEAAVTLKSDIDAWREKTGMNDIRATHMAQTDDDDWNGAWTCKRCLWIMVSMGRVCFLVGCTPEEKRCSYICVRPPPDPDHPVS